MEDVSRMIFDTYIKDHLDHLKDDDLTWLVNKVVNLKDRYFFKILSENLKAHKCIKEVLLTFRI